MSLTGKQAAFVNAYLGPGRFNATASAKLAGYRANSKHSFEAIGSENLTRPGIRAAIDQHFKLSRMNAEEVLIELTTLARGNSKDKVRALALLSAHHGILDGRGRDEEIQKLAEGIAEQRIQAWYDEVHKDVAKYNAEVIATNKKKDAQWETLKLEYKAFPEAVEALTRLRLIMEGKEELEPEQKPTEVQIIPPQKRLQAAPIERMIAEVDNEASEELPPQPPRCRHGYHVGECHVIEVGFDCPHYYKRNEARYRYA